MIKDFFGSLFVLHLTERLYTFVMNNKNIGIDIMGVILPKAVEGGTLEEFMSCSALPDVIASIGKLVELYGNESVFIVSRCPEFAEKVIMRWFDGHDFFNKTNFNRSNIYFCREQAEKASIAKQLRLSYFIDDKISVLDFMKDIVQHRIQLAVESGIESSDNEDDIVRLKNWHPVLEYIARY